MKTRLLKKMNLAVKTLSASNITELCRICLSNEDTCLLSELIIEKTPATQLFQECIKPTIKTETCKESICLNCSKDLLQFYRFKSQATLNERIFDTLQTDQSQTAIIEETTFTPAPSNCKNCKCKNLTLTDLPNICRICFKTENIHPINTLTIENQPAINLLQKFTNETTFKNDQLCETCLDKLYDHYLFQTQFAKHNELFKQLQAPKLEPLVHLNRNNPPPIIAKKRVRNEISPNIKYECFKCRELFPSRADHTVDGHTKFTKKAKCETCQKYITSICLKQHERTHTGERPFACAACPRRFTLNRNLRRHLLTHRADRPFVCDRCGERFNRDVSLAAHLARHGDRPPRAPRAAGPRPLVCETCGRAFAHLAALRAHCAAHGAPRHACAVCKRRFVLRAGLASHMRTHTGERPFACGTCAARFSHAGSLAAHRRMHADERPFACEVCGRAFRQSAHLAAHRRTHTGAKPHQCAYCGRAFAMSCNRKAHERIHVGERRFSCGVCKKTFLHLYAKNKHEKVVHRIDK